MFGLVEMPSSGASLLLNAEGVFTAGLAWWVFKEHFDRRIDLGMLAIVAGAVILSVPAGVQLGRPWPALAVLGACLAWGLDNNLTRKVALHDATWLACVEGLVAGPVNILIALALDPWFPTAGQPVRPWSSASWPMGSAWSCHRRHAESRHSSGWRLLLRRPFFGAVLAVALGDAVTGRCWSREC